MHKQTTTNTTIMYSEYWLYVPVIGLIIALIYYFLYGEESIPFDRNTSEFKLELSSMIQGVGIMLFLVIVTAILVF